MIWVALLVVALVMYFLFLGLRALHISRCHSDTRTTDYVPELIPDAKAQSDFHKRTAATLTKRQGKPNPATSNAPSLLYADRSARSHDENAYANDVQNPVSNHKQTYHQNPGRSVKAPTYETRTGVQHNASNDLDLDLETNETAEHTLETMEYTAENAAINEAAANTATNNDQHSAPSAATSSVNTGAAAAGLAAAAGIAASATTTARAGTRDPNATNSYHSSATDSSHTGSNRQQKNVAHHNAAEASVAQSSITKDDIDLELGDSDSTYNDAEDIHGNNHDQLLDFGDLTADISDMLKELNLRESDSPRLEINKNEFEQLKTGEPGEVQPAKIENVADKLRNMLR